MIATPETSLRTTSSRLPLNVKYFTLHNVKFQPSATDPEYVQKDDCVASDIDVLDFIRNGRTMIKSGLLAVRVGRRDSILESALELIGANKKVLGALGLAGVS